MISPRLSGSACLVCREADGRSEAALTQVILSDHPSASVTAKGQCTLLECANTPPRGLHICVHTKQLVALLLLLKSTSWRKTYDLREKYNSHLLPPTSSAPHNVLPSFQIALLRLTFPPFPLILPITSPVCAPRCDRAVHLCTLTMFIQGAGADVEVFGLFFRSDPAARRRNPAKLKPNRAMERYG